MCLPPPDIFQSGINTQKIAVARSRPDFISEKGTAIPKAAMTATGMRYAAVIKKKCIQNDFSYPVKR